MFVGSFVIGLFVLLLVGGVLATVVYAIARNKPSAILWTGGLLLLLLVGGAMLSLVAFRAGTRSTIWTGQPPNIQRSAGEPGMQVDLPQRELSWAEASVRTGRPNWATLLLFVALVVGGLLLLSKWLRPNLHAERVAGHRGDWHDDDRPRARRGGWGWLLAMILLIPIVLALFALVPVRRAHVAELRQTARAQVEAARRRAERNFSKIADEFDKPRILIEGPQQDLPAAGDGIPFEEARRIIDGDASDGDATRGDAGDGNKSTADAGATDEHAANHDDGEDTPGGVATAETRPDEQDPTVNAAETELNPTALTVRVGFDADRLSRFGLSFDRAASNLRELPVWRGDSVQTDATNLLFVASGIFENAPEVSGVLLKTPLGTFGGSTILLADVATIRIDREETKSDREETKSEREESKIAPAGPPSPAWVDQPPRRSGDRWTEVVVTDPYATAPECYEAADRLLCIATWKHLQRLLGREAVDVRNFRTNDGTLLQIQGDDGYIRAHNQLAEMGVYAHTIRQEIVPVDGDYIETVNLERTFGPMKRLYTRLVFTPEVDAQLRERWQRSQRGDRIAVVGLMGGALVSLVGLAYGLLTLDTWTKGYYTKRLFIGVPAVIIVLLWLLALANN